MVHIQRGAMLIGLLATTLTLAACGDDGDSDAGASAPTGIYTLTEHTNNEEACAEGGASVLESDTERFFAIYNEDIFGFPVPLAKSCESAAQCRARIDETDESFPEWSFPVVVGGWEFSRSFQNEEEGKCNGTAVGTTVVETDDGVKLERRSYTVEGLTIDSDGFCGTDALDNGLDQYPCASLEVYTGTLSESL